MITILTEGSSVVVGRLLYNMNAHVVVVPSFPSCLEEYHLHPIFQSSAPVKLNSYRSEGPFPKLNRQAMAS